MHLKQLKLRNFAQFPERTFDLTAGLTAIVGPNGSGKSNLMAGIEYAIIGELPTAGPQASNKYQGAKPRELAFVELTFVAPAGEYRVTRYIGTKKSVLVCPDGTELEGDSSINQHILDLVGVGRDVLRDVVFVRQDEMFGFLASRPAERAERLARLFSLERAEKLYDLVGAAVPRPQVPDFEQQSADLFAAEQRLLEQQQGVAARQAQLQDAATLAATRDRVVAMLARLQAYQEAAANLPAWEQRLPQLMQSAAAAAEQEQQAVTAIASAEALVSQLQADATREREAVLHWQNQQLGLRARREAETALAAAERSLQELPPEPPDHTEELMRQHAEHAKSLAILQGLEQRQRGMVHGSACPTCQRPWGEELIAAARETADQVLQQSQRVAQHQAELARLRPLVQALTDWRTVRQQRENAVTTAQQVLDRTPEVVDLPRPSCETAMQLQSTQASLGTLRQQLPLFTTTHRQAAAAVTDLQAKISAAREVLAAPADTDGVTAESLQQLLRQIAAELQEHQTCREQLVGIETQLRGNAAEQARVVAERQRYAGLLYAAQLLTEVRDVFHKKAAPADAVCGALDAATPLINELLACFGCGYVVRPTQDLSFDAVFPDGVISPAARLSGGQRVVLAIAFRIAIHFLRAGRLGFLLLDEPTTFLDDQHVSGLEPVLEHVRRFSQQHQLQCLMATHEPKLAPYFDQVIDLG